MTAVIDERFRARPVPRALLTGVFFGAAVLAAGLHTLAPFASADLEPVLVASAWLVASGISAVTALGVAVWTHDRSIHRAWLVWALASLVWFFGAFVRLVAVVADRPGLEGIGDIAWFCVPVIAIASIAYDSPKGSLSFGVFLLDAIPIVLLVAIIARFLSPHDLGTLDKQEVFLVGYPVLYLLLALVGLQMFDLERPRLSSPNLWGFAVAQPYLALAAATWPAYTMGALVIAAPPWDAFWTVGFLAAGWAAVCRASAINATPRLVKFDDSGPRILAPAIGTLGLVVVTLAAPAEYKHLPAGLAVVAVICFILRAQVVRREGLRAQASLIESERTLRTLVSNVPGAVYRCGYGGDWPIDFMSDEIETITGYPVSEFDRTRRQTFSSIEHADDAGRVQRAHQGEGRGARAVRLRVSDRPRGREHALGAGQGPGHIRLARQGAVARRRARGHHGAETRRGGGGDPDRAWRVSCRASRSPPTRRARSRRRSRCASRRSAPTRTGRSAMRCWSTTARCARRKSGTWKTPPAPPSSGRCPSRSPSRTGSGCPGACSRWASPSGSPPPSQDYLPYRLDAAERLGIQSAMAFPVLVGSEVVGVLEFFSTRAVDADAQVLAAMRNVGAILGRVVERSRAEETLEAQNEQLRELDALKDEFISLVSHELRTPLTSIRGYLELVLDDPDSLNEQQQQFLEVVQRNSKRLFSLVSDLLFVAQVDAGRMSVELEDVDLATIAAECVHSAEPHAAAQEVRLELDAEPARFSGDPARLAQLVDNLVSNAIKFTGAGGSVAVRTRTTERGVRLEVADSGMGIPAEEQANLFERFFRSSNARRAAIQGTGLGLVIVQAISEAHGGEVSLESAEGVGTTFRVDLPASVSLREVA